MPEFIKNARAAELAAAQSMRALGFDDAAATPLGPDAGIDVRAEGALAQVKWKGGAAGRPDLQRLYGACAGQHHKAMLFYSAGGFSKSAIEYANSANIALFDYDPNGQATHQNALAKSLVGRAKRKTDAAPATNAQRTNTSQTLDPPDRPVNRDLGQWMESVHFLEDDRPDRSLDRRSGKTRAVPDPPGPIAVRVTAGIMAVICLGLAFLAAWLFMALVAGSLALAPKIVLGVVLVAGGLFVFGMAVFGVHEALPGSSSSKKDHPKPSIWSSRPR